MGLAGMGLAGIKMAVKGTDLSSLKKKKKGGNFHWGQE